MGKIFIRIDDRLIHGQIITAWVRALDITHIIAVDDELASNEVMQSIMLMGVPTMYNPRIVTSDKAVKLLEKTKDTTRVLLVTRYCRNLDAILSVVEKCEVVNIGNTAKQQDQAFNYSGFGVGGTISFNGQDVEVIKRIIDMGLPVTIQQMPSDKVILVKELLWVDSSLKRRIL